MLSPKKLDNKDVSEPLIGVNDDPLSSDFMLLMNREQIPVSLCRIKEPIIVSVFKSAYSEDRTIFKDNNQQHYNPHFQPEDAFLVDAVFYDAPISNQLIGVLDIFTTLSSRASYTCEAEFNKRVMDMFADLEKKFAAEERVKALAEGRVEFETPASPTTKKKKEKVEYIEPFELRILPVVHCSLFKSGEITHVNVCVSRGSSAALWTTTPNNSPTVSQTSSPARSPPRSPLHSRDGELGAFSPPASREGRVDNNKSSSRGNRDNNSPPGSRGRSATVSRGEVRLDSSSLDEFGFATQPFNARRVPPKDYKAKTMKLTQVLLEARNVSSRNMLKWTTQVYATLIALARNYITFNGELTVSDILLIPDKSVLQSLRESQLKVTGPRDVIEKVDPNAPKRKLNKAEKQRILKEKRKVKAFIRAEEEEIVKVKDSRLDRDAWIDPHFCLSKLGTVQKLKQKSKFVHVQEDDMNDIHGFADEEDESTDDSTVESSSTDNDVNDNDSIDQNSQSNASLQSLNSKYALAKVHKEANSNFKFPSKFTLLKKHDNAKKEATCVCNLYDTIPTVTSQYKLFYNGIVKDLRSLGIILIQIILRTVFEPSNNLLKQLKSNKLYYDELIKLITLPKLDNEIIEFLQLCFMEPDPIEISDLPSGTIFKSTYLETCFEMVEVFKEKLQHFEESTKFVKQTYWTLKEEQKILRREQMAAEKSAANVIYGLQMAEKRNAIERYRTWFEIQPENVKRRILHKKAAKKQSLINKEIRRKGVHQSLFHWWGESETCFWINDALTVCMRDAQDIIKMTFQKGKGLPSPHASRAVTPNSKPTSRASSPKKNERAKTPNKKSRGNSPKKGRGKGKDTKPSSASAPNPPPSAVVPTAPASRLGTAKTNKKLNVKFNLVQKQRIKDVVIPISDCMEKVLIFYRIGCKSRRGGATFDDLQEDNKNVVLTLARELSVGITGRCSCLEITKSIRAAREFAADKFSKSIMLSMLPEMQYKVKKLATESEHMVENCTALLDAAKFIATSVGIIDKYWPRKIALMCCIAIIEKYDKLAPIREKGTHLAAHKIVALMRGIVVREKVAQIWYQADKEYEALLEEEEASQNAEILDENNEIIKIEKIDEELEQPNVIKVEGKDCALTVTISINLPLCNFGPGGRQRGFIAVKGILAKQPVKLPDLAKEKSIRKEFSKSLPYDNADVGDTDVAKTTSQYYGSIILVMYDKRQELPIDEEFLKYHDTPDSVKLRVTVTYLGPKPLPQKRRSSSFNPILDEVKPSDTDHFAINIEGLDAYKSYRVQVLMGDIFKAVQKYERNYFIRDIKLVVPTIIKMHERYIVGTTKAGIPETPVFSGVECVFSTAIGSSDSNAHANTRNDILITVGPRALPYVNAVTRMRWERPYCNGSRLLRYKIQKRYIITANPNPYTNSSADTNTDAIPIPNNELEAMALVKGSWKTIVLLPSTANAYTDIVHLPHEIDVDVGCIIDRYINNNTNKSNDDNNDPFSIFIQYRLRAITKVGPGDYTQPITSGHAIITMTTSLKKLRIDDELRDLQTLRNSIINVDNDDISVLSIDSYNHSTINNDKNNFDCGLDGDLISISGNSHKNSVNSVVSSSKLQLRQRSMEATKSQSVSSTTKRSLTDEQLARIKRLEDAWNTDLVDDDDDNDEDDGGDNKGDVDDYHEYHIQPIHGTFPKRNRQQIDEQTAQSNIINPSISRKVEENTKALMTQSPSLGKVKAIIANDAVLHHKWDNKGATSIIDEALIKEMNKLSKVKLDVNPAYNDDANSRKWWKRQEVMMMMNHGDDINDDDNDDTDSTSVHTNNIQLFNQPKEKYNINNDESTTTNEPIDDWIAKLSYKSPLIQQPKE